MKNLFTSYREAAAKRALYRRTRDELASLPAHLALDLGIFPDGAESVARRAVWG